MVRFLHLAAAAIVSIAVPGARAGTDSASVGLVRNWFEWGEYDSILVNVPRLLEMEATAGDSGTMAQLRLYLGVAGFATGEIGDARAEFSSALSLNPLITLDRNYVSSEVYDLFDATVSEWLRLRAEKARRDSLFLEKQRQLEREVAAVDSLRRAGKARARGGRFLAGIGAWMGAGVLAALSVGEYYSTNETYDRFVSASSRGDLAARNRYRDQTRRGDGLTVVAAVAAVASATTGTIFLVRAGRTGEGRSAAGGGGEAYGFGVTVEF